MAVSARLGVNRGTVRKWRARFLVRRLDGLGDEVYREVYLLTPAERQTRLYSNRFAADILRYRQTYALMKERHWTTNFLGPHDGGYDGHARREFSDADLTAVSDHYAIDPGDHYGDVDLGSTDHGNDPHLGYWQHFELGDRFLRVHGRQHTYKIHIGSANIQIEPDNRYLCIVPRSTARPKVMLPSTATRCSA